MCDCTINRDSAAQGDFKTAATGGNDEKVEEEEALTGLNSRKPRRSRFEKRPRIKSDSSVTIKIDSAQAVSKQSIDNKEITSKDAGHGNEKGVLIKKPVYMRRRVKSDSKVESQKGSRHNNCQETNVLPEKPTQRRRRLNKLGTGIEEKPNVCAPQSSSAQNSEENQQNRPSDNGDNRGRKQMSDRHIYYEVRALKKDKKQPLKKEKTIEKEEQLQFMSKKSSGSSHQDEAIGCEIPRKEELRHSEQGPTRQKWPKPSVSLPYQTGHSWKQQNGRWSRNILGEQRGTGSSRYKPYHFTGKANEKRRDEIGSYGSGWRIQEHCGWRHAQHYGTASSLNYYQSPEHWRPLSFVPQFFNSDISNPHQFTQHRNKNEICNRKNRLQRHDFKVPLERTCSANGAIKEQISLDRTQSDDSITAKKSEGGQLSGKREQVSPKLLDEAVTSSDSKNVSHPPLNDPATIVNRRTVLESNATSFPCETSVYTAAARHHTLDKAADDDPRTRSVVINVGNEREFGAAVSAIIEHFANTDYEVNRVLRVMMDLLHPDARDLLDCLGISCSDFYRLCSRLAKVEFEDLHDLNIFCADDNVLERLFEEIGWICRSILVPFLAQQAFLADEHIDFSRLDLDIFKTEGIDCYKELALIFALADDFHSIPELLRKDTSGWLNRCMAMKEIFEAFVANNKETLKQLGVVDTAQSVVEKIELGMTISDKEITMLLHESMNSGFGEYTWLVEDHRELISTVEHFECIMEAIPQMQKCVDIRPLQRTMTVIPSFLAGLSVDERDRCVARHLGKYELLKAARSWVQIIRNALDIDSLSLELTAQFLFCSTVCGAEKLLSALLENIPLDKKIMAIECIDRFPPCLSQMLLSNSSENASLYAVTKRMAEEMSPARFERDAIFLIGNLCRYSSLSPSKLLTQVFIPMMSTSARGKAALAISSLVSHKVFREEVSQGSTVLLSELLTSALEHYEAPSKSSCNSRYTFIESILLSLCEILSENKSAKIDVDEVFSKLQNITWYQKVMISHLYFDGIGQVTVKYPWNNGDGAVKSLETLSDLPLILSSWPGDHSSFFEKFIKEKKFDAVFLSLDNFDADDADLLSQVMLLTLDRKEECEHMNVFANAIYAICPSPCDWEELLLELQNKDKNLPSVSFNSGNTVAKDSLLDTIEGLPLKIYENADKIEIHTDVTACTSEEDPCIRCEPYTEESPENSREVNVSEQSSSAEEAQNQTLEGKDCDVVSKRTLTCDELAVMQEDEDEEFSFVKSCISQLLVKINENEDLDSCRASPVCELVEEVKNSLQDDTTGNYSTKSTEDQSKLDVDATFSESVCSAKLEDVKISNQAADSNDEDWDSLECVQKKIGRDQVLQDLRTFTWALDTVEMWPECPSSIRNKVLSMASKCHCDVIKARAFKMADISY